MRFQLAADPVVKAIPAPSKEQQATEAETPTIAILYSCSSGEQSLAESGADGCSYFTRALCQVFKADDDIATLESIVAATQKTLTALLGERNLPPYKPVLDERPIIGRGGPHRTLLIKENQAARIKQRMADSSWCKNVRDNPLCAALEGDAPALMRQVLWLVLGAEDLFTQAEKLLPNQRWRDRNAPGRVLQRLQTLLNNNARLLTAPETGLAVAAIYLYEAALAAGELKLAACGDPLQPLGEPAPANANRAWSALKSAVLAEEALNRRYALLQQEGRCDIAVDLAAWRLTRFLHHSGEMWE